MSCLWSFRGLGRPPPIPRLVPASPAGGRATKATSTLVLAAACAPSQLLNCLLRGQEGGLIPEPKGT